MTAKAVPEYNPFDTAAKPTAVRPDVVAQNSATFNKTPTKVLSSPKTYVSAQNI